MKSVSRAFGVSRSNLCRPLSPKSKRHCDEEGDSDVFEQLRDLVSRRPSYGYRRATAMLNRKRQLEGKALVNHKRAYRLMKEGKLLLPKHSGRTTRTHEGKIITLKSDLRWCSDGFEIRCWNGEKVYVVFSLDCCDRMAMAFSASTFHPTAATIQNLMVQTVEERFGANAKTTPHFVEWLTDNGPIYIAHETREFGRSLGLIICNTPSYSPESNGMAEAFVKTFKRDYVYCNELHTAATVLEELPKWFDDYNRSHPHSALKMKSPTEFRQASLTQTACPI